MPNEDIELLSVNEVAEIYKLSKSSVYKWVKSGRIPAPIPRWAGSDKRWSRASIAAHIKRMASEAHTEEAA